MQGKIITRSKYNPFQSHLWAMANERIDFLLAHFWSIIHCSLTSDSSIYKRITQAAAAFGTVKTSLVKSASLKKSRHKCTRLCSCPLCFMAAKLGPF
jgi:hypothetical protein